MKDVNQHYMEHHRDTHMFPCWECNKKFKTIVELKTHFAKLHFNKNSNRDYSSFLPRRNHDCNIQGKLNKLFDYFYYCSMIIFIIAII